MEYGANGLVMEVVVLHAKKGYNTEPEHALDKNMEEVTAKESVKRNDLAIPKYPVHIMEYGHHGQAMVNVVSNAVQVCNTEQENALDKNTEETNVLEMLENPKLANPIFTVLLMDITLNGLAIVLAALHADKELNTEQEHVLHLNMAEKTVLEMTNNTETVTPTKNVQVNYLTKIFI